MSMNTPTSGTVLDFSLARGDPLFRLQQKLGLIPPGGQGLVRRAVFWSMLGWLPIAVWAFFVNRALPGEVQEPLLAHFGVHARLLVAVPLLIIAEGPASAMLRGMLHHLVGSGIVPHTQRAWFEAAVRGAVRMRDATLPWVVIAAIVLAIVTYSSVTERAHEADWAHAEAGAQGLGFGGLWFLYVGRSIYLALVLVWLWRIVVVSVLMWRVARLELSLVPTHPDRAGGLGFLEGLPAGFAPVVFAIGCVLASRWAHDAVYHGLELTSLRVEMIGFVVLCIVMLSLPLLAFRAPSKRMKKQALLDYGDLIGRHGRLVHRRWIEGREVGQPPILEAPELGPVADTAAMYDAVRSMRAMPLGKSALLTVGLAAALPMVGVLALQIPFKQIMLTLMKAVL
jgi:hypothetical protein